MKEFWKSVKKSESFRHEFGVGPTTFFGTQCILLYVFDVREVCRENKAGRQYIGQLNMTKSGKQCQAWTSNTPHVPNDKFHDTSFPDGSREAAENYCRNPDSFYLNGVWCYTMDPNVRREDCDVPECGTVCLFLSLECINIYPYALCILVKMLYAMAASKSVDVLLRLLCVSKIRYKLNFEIFKN